MSLKIMYNWYIQWATLKSPKENLFFSQPLNLGQGCLISQDNIWAHLLALTTFRQVVISFSGVKNLSKSKLHISSRPLHPVGRGFWCNLSWQDFYTPSSYTTPFSVLCPFLISTPSSVFYRFLNSTPSTVPHPSLYSIPTSELCPSIVHYSFLSTLTLPQNSTPL